MQVPLKISFHNMDTSEGMEARVRERVDRLEKMCDCIISCRIALEAPHKQPHRSTVGISISVSVPGKEIVVKREQRQHESRGDSYQVIGVAFDVAERQLEDYLRVMRHDVKNHDGPSYARIIRFYPEQEYGFIETPTNTNVYFHRAVVQEKDFEALNIGSEVLYTLAAEEGPMGPQASKVQLVRGQHAVR
jgi:cold shock CspA family protein/ribosome-associated translation inhibitor RaiA